MEKNSKKFWTEKRELKLIELWKQAPCLYDHSDEDFTNKAAKNQTLLDIANATNSSGK